MSIFKNSVSRISHIGLVAVHVQISNTSALLEGLYVFNNMDNKLLRTFGAKFQGSFTIFLCEITVPVATLPTVPKWPLMNVICHA